MDEEPVPLPSAPSRAVGLGVTLQPPLSRRGHGPGLLLVIPKEYDDAKAKNETLDPDPLQKWAEEGYAVAQVVFDDNEFSAAGKRALDALVQLDECDVKDQICLLLYGPADKHGEIMNVLHMETTMKITATVAYEDVVMPETHATLYQLAGSQQTSNPAAHSEAHSRYHYPEAKSAGFMIPGHADYRHSSANVAHTRALTFLKKRLDGPYFDLEKIWEEHTEYEFAVRSVARTMGTMVQEPYVNHVPTMTGGIGRTSLSNFYRDHFIFSNPDNTSMELISRTVGIDRVIDEFIFSFTHDKVMDWLLPGVPPTNKDIRIPFTSVVNIRGDRLYHEHIAWDQATVLVQAGLLPEYLPFPYPLPNGQTPGPSRRFEYRVPAAGVETAQKMKDQTAVKSNEMIETFKIREVPE